MWYHNLRNTQARDHGENEDCGEDEDRGEDERSGDMQDGREQKRGAFDRKRGLGWGDNAGLRSVLVS
jgi:hypothetical protein